ncbi:nucleotide pyrophosphohydrolase [Sebaldella sp. S0638]|uniref:nucleotide pyrophosphohydrolase n=1 Tax=Sebaldella sp. S0638 TaxID=2957809 RepID=UPI00209D1BFB|nr:nucleotide pyrophosphohydrolase [Sebaldella sp. S0638]MCP1225825.1 nucleotide pyrophosphohydrolase [Sebaldella sp. S0638]
MTYEDIRDELREFVKERNWEKFHNLKDLALSVSIEASELVEIFQWRNPEEMNDEDLENIKFELADVLIYVFFMCDKLGIEPYEIIREKMEINKGRVFKF